MRLEGDFVIADAATFLRDLRALAHEAAESDEPRKRVDFDLSEAGIVDGAAMSLLVAVKSDLVRRGFDARIVGATGPLERLVELYESRSDEPMPRRAPEGFVAHLGRQTIDAFRQLRDVLGFLGDLVLAFGHMIRRPQTAHLRELPTLIEQGGIDAMPIVLVINFLVGFVMAFDSARQLQTYGANLYVADFVGIGITRELAPLMTAIIVCGRSGAAYAAEIGAMKVSEEVDALRTIGISPFGWLVVPRVLTLVIVTPILTLMSDLIGAIGGAVVGVTTLGLTLRMYFHETQNEVDIHDIAIGLLKSVVFALAIGLVSCQQGFAATEGAAGVGRRTTSTVVTCLFALVVLDAIITLAFRAMGL